MELPYAESISSLPESQSLHHTFELILIQNTPVEVFAVWWGTCYMVGTYSPYSQRAHSQVGNLHCNVGNFTEMW